MQAAATEIAAATKARMTAKLSKQLRFQLEARKRVLTEEGGDGVWPTSRGASSRATDETRSQERAAARVLYASTSRESAKVASRRSSEAAARRARRHKLRMHASAHRAPESAESLTGCGEDCQPSKNGRESCPGIAPRRSVRARRHRTAKHLQRTPETACGLAPTGSVKHEADPSPVCDGSSRDWLAEQRAKASREHLAARRGRVLQPSDVPAAVTGWTARWMASTAEGADSTAAAAAWADSLPAQTAGVVDVDCEAIGAPSPPHAARSLVSAGTGTGDSIPLPREEAPKPSDPSGTAAMPLGTDAADTDSAQADSLASSLRESISSLRSDALLDLEVRHETQPSVADIALAGGDIAEAAPASRRARSRQPSASRHAAMQHTQAAVDAARSRLAALALLPA